MDVTVTDAKGQQASLPHGFTYQSMTLRAERLSRHCRRAADRGVEAPIGRDPDDWVGLFRVGDSAETYDQHWCRTYTNGGATGSKTLTAPLLPGSTSFDTSWKTA